MDVQHKDATITNTGDDFPGSFEVILSTKAKDRDGDELQPEDWKAPLPDHITFDADHGMSVATTVGSGTPSLEDGKLVVRGTYSSLPRAQEVRTLVNEGHIRTTSVAFMTEKSEQKDGTTRQVRELLNGAFVAIPSNREALVLSSKSATSEKAGARNSAADQEALQAAHDAIVQVGAVCAGDPDEDGWSMSRSAPEPEVKAASGEDAADEAVDAAVTEAIRLLGTVEDPPDAVAEALKVLSEAKKADDAEDASEPDDEAKSLADDVELKAQMLRIIAESE